MTDRRHRLLPLAVTVALFALLYGAGAYHFDGFFSLQVFLNFFIDNAFLAITAIGMTFVILSGGIDLSVGSVIALTTMVSAMLVQNKGWSPGLVIPLVLAMGSTMGLAMGLIIQTLTTTIYAVGVAPEVTLVVKGLVVLVVSVLQSERIKALIATAGSSAR